MKLLYCSCIGFFSFVIALVSIGCYFLWEDLEDEPHGLLSNEHYEVLKELKHSSLVKGKDKFVYSLQFADQSLTHQNNIGKCNSIPQAFTNEALKSVDAAIEMVKMGKSEKAHKLFQHALAIAPRHPDVLNHYGEFLEKCHKDLLNADYLYFKALIQSPGHSSAVINHNRVVEIVQEMDFQVLSKIDRKRDYVASIPEANSALRKAKLEAYFQHIYHTVGIEGNTMTLSETRAVVETKMAVIGKSLVEHNEILGLDAALKYINTTLVNRIGRITVEDILEIHRRVMGYVDPIEAGTFRRTQVFVGGHIPPKPSKIPPLMQKFESWLNSWKTLRLHPVEYAALAHYKLVFLHPFYDGNGRTSRLLMNTILMQAGYPPVIILKQDRHRYYRTIEMANEGDIRPFIRFIAECTEHTLDLFIWGTSDRATELPALASKMIRDSNSGELEAVKSISTFLDYLFRNSCFHSHSRSSRALRSYNRKIEKNFLKIVYCKLITQYILEMFHNSNFL